MNFNFSRVSKHLAIGFVIISALVMGYILYALDTTKTDQAGQLIEQSSDRINTELDKFFLPVENLMLSLKQQQEFHFFDDLSNTKLNQYYIPIIDQFAQISSVGIADGRGYELNILPDSLDGEWINREVYVDEWGMVEKWSSWKDDNGLTKVETWESELQRDPRTRPWYTGAVAQNEKQIHWTDPYFFLTNEEIGLTASTVWSSGLTDSLTKILAIDLTLKDVTRFSQGLSITENNQIFILTEKEENIVGLPQDLSNLNPENMMDEIFSTPSEFGNEALVSLLEHSRNDVVSFNHAGVKWWGMIDSYPINSTQKLLIAILIPENDFAAEINRTERVMVAGFLSIIFLAFLLVRNHNSLRNAKTSLNEQNEIITQQKERLFAEVHHRVKNNLAIMGALIELESMESTDEAVKLILTRSQRRIKSMSAVHEIMYKTDDVNKVQITEFIPGIINFSKKDFDDVNVDLDLSIDEVIINVNQALTYALLINEIMSSILKGQIDITECLKVEVFKDGQAMVTKIRINANSDYSKTRIGVGKQLIQVLVAQLDAELKTTDGEKHVTHVISFTLEDKSGTTSNL